MCMFNLRFVAFGQGWALLGKAVRRRSCSLYLRRGWLPWVVQRKDERPQLDCLALFRLSQSRTKELVFTHASDAYGPTLILHTRASKYWLLDSSLLFVVR